MSRSFVQWYHKGGFLLFVLFHLLLPPFILIKVSIVRSTAGTSQLTIQRSVPLFLRVREFHKDTAFRLTELTFSVTCFPARPLNPSATRKVYQQKRHSDPRSPLYPRRKFNVSSVYRYCVTKSTTERNIWYALKDTNRSLFSCHNPEIFNGNYI